MDSLLKGFPLFTGLRVELSTDADSSVSEANVHGLVSIEFEMKPINLHIDLEALGASFIYFRLKSYGFDPDEVIPYLNPSAIARAVDKGLREQLEKYNGVEPGTVYFLERTRITSAWCSAAGEIDQHRVLTYSYKGLK